MIRGITITRRINDAAEYERLASLFEGVGVDRCNCRDDPTELSHQFLAPLDNLRLVHISLPAPDISSEISVEVISLDSIRQVTQAWLKANLSDGTTGVSEIVDTHWESRLFTATPVPGHSVTFWAWSDPLKGKPLAVEGDLSAKGMLFAIVTARWNAVITERLLHGSLDALYRSGAGKADVEILRVPGAWEIPSAPRKLAETGKFDAIITLACFFGVKRHITKPSITKSRVASGTRSRKRGSLTPSAS